MESRQMNYLELYLLLIIYDTIYSETAIRKHKLKHGLFQEIIL